MEVNLKKTVLEMDKLNSYIRIFDDVLPKDTLKTFRKICEEHIDYDCGEIVGIGKQKIDLEVRNVKLKSLSNIYDKSFTTVHWASFLLFKFKENINRYIKDFNMTNFDCSVIDIQILKYEKGGHYKFHTDHGPTTPRTLSLIYFVNDDFEGGNLNFKLVGSGGEMVIENKPNRLVIWPSNFMYPHRVTPVESGTRYSVVAWAL